MDIPPNNPPGNNPSRKDPQASDTKRRSRKKRGKSSGREVSASVGSGNQPQGASALLRELSTRHVITSGNSKLSPAGQERLSVLEDSLAHRQASFKVGNAAEVILEDYFKEALMLEKKHGRALEINYVLAYYHFLKGAYPEAQQYCDDLMRQVEEGSSDEPRAFLLRGKITYYRKHELTGSAASDFARAYKLGHPVAGRYLMAAKRVKLTGISALQWADPPGLVDIARKMPALEKKYLDNLMKEGNRAPSAVNALRCLMCNWLEAYESVVQPHEQWEFNTWFPLLICEMFEKGDDEQADIDKKIHVALGLQQRRGFDVVDCEAIYHYARIVRSGMSEKHIDALLNLPTSVAHMLAGSVQLKNASADKKAALDLLVSAKDLPMSYQLRVEAFLESHQIKKALDVCYEAISFITGYMKGHETFYGYKFTEQAQGLIQRNEAELAGEMLFSELHAANALLKKFQIQAELLEDALNEPPSNKNTRSLVAVSISGNREEIKAAGRESDEDAVAPLNEAVSNLLVSEKVRPSEKSTQEKTDAINREPTLPDTKLQSEITRANRLLRDQSELDEAEAILKKLHPEPGSLLWYRKQQTLCWLYHEKATSYDYLSGKAKQSEGKRVSAIALDYLDKSKKLTIKMVKELVKKAEEIEPELKGLESSGRFYLDADRYSPVARALDQKNPGFRKLYGGLYSVLGHIEKAYRDNPAFAGSAADALQRGTRYYQIANDIRGYGASVF